MGYTVPFMRLFAGDANRSVCAMPAAQGAEFWPRDGRGLTLITEEAELPFPDASIDRILLVHDLEFAELLKPNLQEIWRVLKADGRVLICIPNRTGLWSRSDRTPFGQGTPYSAAQMRYFLRDNLFSIERVERALFVPPFRSLIGLSAAPVWEKIGRALFPTFAGVNIVEARKQIYGGLAIPSENRIQIRGRRIVPIRPMPVS